MIHNLGPMSAGHSAWHNQMISSSEISRSRLASIIRGTDSWMRKESPIYWFYSISVRSSGLSREERSEFIHRASRNQWIKIRDLASPNALTLCWLALHSHSLLPNRGTGVFAHSARLHIRSSRNRLFYKYPMLIEGLDLLRR